MNPPSSECITTHQDPAEVLNPVAQIKNESPEVVAGDSSHWHPTRETLIRIAEAAACTRPLTPYPGWRFDIDWDNPDPVFRIRQEIWSYFRACRTETKIQVPWHYGMRLNLWLSNDLSKQLFIAGCDEPNEMAFVDGFLKPGMVVLDAGANDGVYTLLASSRVGSAGRVWAFEPSSREFLRLSRNLALNSISNVSSFHTALSDNDEELELKIAESEHSGQNTFGNFAYQIAGMEPERVSARQLDGVLRERRIDRLDLIKLDVEGAELKILRGAARTLENFRPVLLLEVSELSLRNMGSSAAELLSFVRSLRYDLYVFDRETGLPALARPGELSGNMLAAPIENPIPVSLKGGWNS